MWRDTPDLVCFSLQYSRGQEAAGAPDRGRHDAGAPGRITIGGSGHVRSRFGQRGHEVGAAWSQSRDGNATHSILLELIILSV